MLNLTQSIIKRKFFVPYSQKKISITLSQQFLQSETSSRQSNKSCFEKYTLHSLKKMKTDTSIDHMPFQHIPAKSLVVPPIDYCTFTLLKKATLKCKPTMIDGLWKVVKEECKTTLLEIL